MNNKISFLISSPEFSNKSGGIIALHRLADLLGKFGETSYINVRTFTDSSAIYLSKQEISNLNLDTTIFIYPEITVGNPYGAKHVVRWILNTPKLMGGDGIYQDTDLIYKYWDYFKLNEGTKVIGELRSLNLKLEHFYNRNNSNRTGECFMIRKGKLFNKDINQHSPEALNIDNYDNDQYLSDVFSEKHTFISYDAITYHSIQAALCGCISIVIPDPGISKEDWVNKSPIFKYGVAYGKDDIQWAIDTMPMVKDHLINLENESFELIKNFISNCYRHVLMVP